MDHGGERHARPPLRDARARTCADTLPARSDDRALGQGCDQRDSNRRPRSGRTFHPSADRSTARTFKHGSAGRRRSTLPRPRTGSTGVVGLPRSVGQRRIRRPSNDAPGCCRRPGHDRPGGGQRHAFEVAYLRSSGDGPAWRFATGCRPRPAAAGGERTGRRRSRERRARPASCRGPGRGTRSHGPGRADRISTRRPGEDRRMVAGP